MRRDPSTSSLRSASRNGWSWSLPMHTGPPFSSLDAHSFLSFVLPKTCNAAALEFFLLQQATLETARRHSLDAAAAGTSSWDLTHPASPAFAEGDNVWLSSAPFNFNKTTPRWLGPFPMARVMTPTTFKLDLPANMTHHPVWHCEHLRAATPTHATTPYAPVIDPPLRVEQILAHKRLRGRGLNYELTVKWLDKPLGHLPLTISLSDALIKGAAVTRAYFKRWNLGII